MALTAITITETRRATIYVDADYDFNALAKVKKDYENGVITTYSDDIVDVNFEIMETE